MCPPLGGLEGVPGRTASSRAVGRVQEEVRRARTSGLRGSEYTAPHWVLGQVSGLEVARRRNSTLLPRPSPHWERTNVGARRSITTM